MTVYIDKILETIQIGNEYGSNLYMEFSNHSEKDFLCIVMKDGDDRHYEKGADFIAKTLTVEEAKVLAAYLNERIARIADIESK